jgi:IclR family acetate operon transcriptional repressor
MSIESSSFGKSIAILEQLSAAGDIDDLPLLAKTLGMPPATLRRLLGDLTQDGFTAYDAASKTYRLGPGALHFASLLRRRYPLERIARPSMRQIAAATGETIALYVHLRDLQMVVCAAIEESRRPLQYVLSVGEQSDFLDGVGGSTIAAFLPPEQQFGLLSQLPQSRAAKQACANLEKEWSKCRKRGYVLSGDKKLPGVVCMGAPVFSVDSMAVASVVIAIPDHRYQKTAETRLAKTLLRHVADISFMLGHPAAAEPE